MKFSEYLADVRENCKLTQNELVEILYSNDIEHFSTLTAGTLSRWESGYSVPSLEKKKAILRYFMYNYPIIEPDSIEIAEDYFYKQVTQGYLDKTSDVQYDFPLEGVELEDLTIMNLHECEGVEGVVERSKQLKKALESSYSTLSQEQALVFSKSKSNIYAVVEYNHMFLGFFSAVKLKPEVFEKVMNFEMKIQDIEEKDLAMEDEQGSLFLLFFFSLNLKATSRLNMRFMAYMITNLKTVENIGALVSNKISPERIKTFDMKKFKTTTLEDGVELVSYRETTKEVMLSEYCVKKFFLPE